MKTSADDARRSPRNLARTLLADAMMYGRFALGLRSFLRKRVSPEQARALVHQRLADRDAAFLRMVERGIYNYSRSPYRPLLDAARCELGDLTRMVRTKGLEATLRELRAAGVYVSFEEFKGRVPIVRDGRVTPVEAHDFDNPFLRHAYQAESGGSTGAGTRIEIDLDYVAALVPLWVLTADAHGGFDSPAGIWYGALPDSSGILAILFASYLGIELSQWFSPLTSSSLKPALKYRLATNAIVAMARAFGVAAPWPQPVPLDQAVVIARWIAATLQTSGSGVFATSVSLALRVCLAAREAGLNLDGARFFGGGEPPTPTKVREITASGARWIPTYGFQEAGMVAVGCGNPADGNDLHLAKDIVALIQHSRQVPGFDITVQAFHFTSLLPTAPKLLLNVETDDYGEIETRPCGCPLEANGFTDHLRHINSFSKLTGEGVTLVGREMVHILEEVLPARFGGTPLDYQLLEEEGEQGFTRLSLLISPRVHISDEAQVIETVMEALRLSSAAADVARAIWSQAETLRVQRREPIWTARGKLLALHLAQRLQHGGDASDAS